MKLALVLLLLIPAFHCTFVPNLCEKADQYIRIGLFGTFGDFESYIRRFTKHQQVIASGVKMKACVTRLSMLEKMDYYEMSMKRMAYCESPKLYAETA